MGLMALANLRRGSHRRHLHLFDAFQEICEPDAAVDGQRAVQQVREITGRSGHDRGRLTSIKGFYDFLGGPGTLEENQRLMELVVRYPKEYVHYHVGWFQKTLPYIHEDIGQIAILRLDCDWFASTKVCLEYLYEKVPPGGIVIIDDYGTYEGCKKAVDEFMEGMCVKAYLAPVDGDCRFMVKVS